MAYKLRGLGLAAMASASLALGIAACSSTDVDEDDSDTGSGATSGTGDTGQGGGQTTTTGQGGDGTLTVGAGGDQGAGGSCVDIQVEGEAVTLPADIIFVIDNSGSMGDEIASVEQNINVNFAQIIGSSGVDYQVIMITDHGSSNLEVCIGPPLANTANCNGAPGEVMNQFYHYDINVQSADSLCIALDTLYGTNNGGEADEQTLHPEGWSKWLRQNAVKVFVEITDDRVSCNWNGNNFNDGNDNSQNAQTSQAAAVAVAWDQQLLQLAPAQFGTTAARNYQFYSIVGVIEDSPNPLEGYQPAEPIVAADCSSAVNAGFGYQWLSKGTGGLRFPVCQFSSYDAVFQAIAAGVVQGAAVPCEIDISGVDETVDPGSLVVNYTPDMGSLESFTQVMGAAACGVDDQAFYLENDIVKLCPAACDKVTADQGATLDVVAQCAGTAE